MRRWVIGLMVGAMACGGGDEGEEGDTRCAAPAGDYTLTFWPVSGDCGVLEAVLAPGGVPPITGCEDGSETWSDDRCTAVYSGRCPAEPPYDAIELEITVRWERDATQASGEATARGYDADGVLGCTGEYEIRMSEYEQ